MNTRATASTVLLQLEQFCQNYVIPMHVLIGAKVKVETMLLPWMDGFETRMIAYIGEHRVYDRKATFPTTWWDALKDRWLPQWARRFVAIRYTTIEVKVGELASKWKLPEIYGPMQIMRWDERAESILESNG